MDGDRVSVPDAAERVRRLAARRRTRHGVATRTALGAAAIATFAVLVNSMGPLRTAPEPVAAAGPTTAPVDAPSGTLPLAPNAVTTERRADSSEPTTTQLGPVAGAPPPASTATSASIAVATGSVPTPATPPVSTGPGKTSAAPSTAAAPEQDTTVADPAPTTAPPPSTLAPVTASPVTPPPVTGPPVTAAPTTTPTTAPPPPTTAAS
jgi:hypothetical protein